MFIEKIREVVLYIFSNFFGIFIHTKFFLLFVLFFPLIVVCFYLVVYLVSRFSFLVYLNIFKSKEMLIFFGFFYFFLFILLLEDFIFYTEMYRAHFVFSLDDLSKMTSLYSKLK